MITPQPLPGKEWRKRYIRLGRCLWVVLTALLPGVQLADASLAAELTGAVVALVDVALCLQRYFARDDAECFIVNGIPSRVLLLACLVTPFDRR